MLYSEDYFTGASAAGVNYMTGSDVGRYDRRRFRSVLKELEKVGARSGRLLDVGCATGNFLLSAREAGWDVEGSEVSEAAAQFAQEQHGLTVHAGLLGSADLPPDSFDVITLNHVLEHIPDPVGFLRDDVAPLLREDGLLMIEVPNIESVQARVESDAWEHLRPEQHLFHFGPDSLRMLLTEADYEIVRLSSLPEQEIQIRGMFVYLGVPTSRASDPADESTDSEGGPERAPARQLLRRMARVVSLPAASYHAARGQELRLMAIARLPQR